MAQDTELEQREREERAARNGGRGESGDGKPAASKPGSTRAVEAEEFAEGPQRSRARSYFEEHPKAKFGLVFLVIAFLAAAFFVWRHYAGKEQTDDAQLDAHIFPVSARVGGTVTKVNSDENMMVKAGDLLVELDPKDYQVALAKAQADVADARSMAVAARTGVPLQRTGSSSQLAGAEAAYNAAQSEEQSMQARVGEAQANYNKVATDLKRYQQLIQRDEISRQQYDAAVAAEQAAQASLDSARAAAANAHSKVIQAEAGVQAARTVPEQIQVSQAKAGSAEASVDRNQAALQMAQLNLDYTKVLAPISGVVNKRNVEPGQVVQPGQPLFSVVDLSDIWVTANFKETQLKDMRVGQKAEIKVDAFDHTYEGHVDSFGGSTGARSSVLPPENATGNYVKVVQRVPVKIVFEKGQDEQLLRPGMSVNVTVFTK